MRRIPGYVFALIPAVLLAPLVVSLGRYVARLYDLTAILGG